MYINIETKAYPVSQQEIRQAYPNTSFAEPFQAPEAYAWVFDAPAPAYDPVTQRVREIAPADTIKGHWEQQWEVIALDAETIASNQANALEQTKIAYTAALDNHYLETAKAKGYDTQYTCALRAGYPGPFHDECLAFATWMDNCNIYAYSLMSEVVTGVKPLPSLVEFIAGLPELTWPGA